MPTRVEIDLNVRVRGNWTFTGVDEADAPVSAGETVRVFEPESGLEGWGRVEEVDAVKGLLYLSVDWASVSEPAPTLTFADLVGLGVQAAVSTGLLWTAPGERRETPTRAVGRPAVACPA